CRGARRPAPARGRGAPCPGRSARGSGGAVRRPKRSLARPNPRPLGASAASRCCRHRRRAIGAPFLKVRAGTRQPPPVNRRGARQGPGESPVGCPATSYLIYNGPVSLRERPGANPGERPLAKPSKVALEDCFLPAIKTTTGKTTGIVWRVVDLF